MMKINPTAFGIACAAATTAVWLVLGLLWMALPIGMMDMGSIESGNTAGGHMNMGITMLVYGLAGWSLLAGVTGWLIAMIYNRLVLS